MRQCTRCHKEKPCNCFEKPNGGHFKLCDACRNYVRQWQIDHPDSRQETGRRYMVSKKGKACAKRYAQSDKGRIVRRKQVVRYQATKKGQATKIRARKKYLASEKGKATIRAYWRGPGREAGKRYRRKYPERSKARHAINYALKKGHIEKPATCEICGCTIKLHGHHYAGWDEEHTLDVWWLCGKCDPPITSVLPHDDSLTLEQARTLIIPTPGD